MLPDEDIVPMERVPCRLWLSSSISRTVLSAAAATGTPIGIVYTAEKEYDNEHYGLKTFGRKIAGDYPRVGILGLGDTVTTNCLQYDTTDFTTEEALFAALEAWETTPVYVTLVAGSPVPKLAKAKPASGIYGKVTKFYTVPNGEKGVKYQIVNL